VVIYNSGSKPGLYAQGSGVGDAVQGEGVSANGVGGTPAHRPRFWRGVWGSSSAAGGTGIRLKYTQCHRTGVALRANVLSSSGVAAGRAGAQPRLEGPGQWRQRPDYGVRSQADSSDGQALHGDAGGLGAAYGVFGSAPLSGSGAGVYGTSAKHGVWGVSTGGGASYGVYGQAADHRRPRRIIGQRGQQPTGVYGTSSSSDGTGVYGEAISGASGSAFWRAGQRPAPAAAQGSMPGRGARGCWANPPAANGHGVEG